MLDSSAKSLGAKRIRQKAGSENCFHILYTAISIYILPYQKESYKANFLQGA